MTELLATDLIGGIHTQFPSRQRKVFSKLGRAIAKAEGGAE